MLHHIFAFGKYSIRKQKSRAVARKPRDARVIFSRKIKLFRWSCFVINTNPEDILLRMHINAHFYTPGLNHDIIRR